MYLYCRKRGTKSVIPIPCQTQKKKKDMFTRPKDYFLEIIPADSIPDVEKPPPQIPPRPQKLFMLTESLDDNEGENNKENDDNDKEVEIINVAYGVDDKKNID
uniref:Uncharacterized protein n=1 Tax=viral metagenome TaxID=1070528 RepID=A0A6C0CQI8_9ZZZZ